MVMVGFVGNYLKSNFLINLLNLQTFFILFFIIFNYLFFLISINFNLKNFLEFFKKNIKLYY